MLNDEERAAAESIQRRHLREVAGIRADGDRSDRGKRSAIARVTLAARSAMAELRAASDARDSQRRADLQFRLFGMGARDRGADLLAARDARDRAAKIRTPAEAAQMLEHAERAGDTSLARAVFERAWDAVPTAIGSAWGDVGAAYLAGKPQVHADAAELADMLTSSPHTRMRDRLSTRVETPEEVATGSLEALAADRASPE
jgi:hypothetical protein